LKNHKQKGGRKRPADAEFVINQVKQRFGEKMVELGARNAAAEIGVGLASFYNYINGKTVPDIDVLRRAKEVWDIKWPKLMDPSTVLPTRTNPLNYQVALQLRNRTKNGEHHLSGRRARVHLL
jgi:hypothetical protein